MDTSSLHELIETAVAIETKEGYLARYLQDQASARGMQLGDEERREAIELFEGYIRSVPTLLTAARESSIGTPVEATMEKVVLAAVTYWDEPEDLVPDELGVLGLLDDAYFSLRMLRKVSDRLEAESGHALVSDDLSALDTVVRDILGEVADILDDFVDLSLSNAPVDELVATVAEHAGTFELPSAASSFAGQCVHTLVGAHLAFASAPPDGSSDTIDPLRHDLIGALEADPAEHDELVRAAFRRALDDGAISGEADVELALSMLVGAVLHRSRAGAVDSDFVARCVDHILDVHGWQG